jgi:hypothetical protein
MDLELAIQITKADLVVVSIGNGDNVKQSNIRTESAKALVQVLVGQRVYRHVHVLVLSMIGAGGSGGVGKLTEFHLRHVLQDHSGQEAVFLSSMKDRTLIVRPTALAKNKSIGKVVTFDSTGKYPTKKTDRKDLADWLVREAICRDWSSGRFGLKPITVTSVKSRTRYGGMYRYRVC